MLKLCHPKKSIFSEGHIRNIPTKEQFHHISCFREELFLFKPIRKHNWP